MSAENWSVYRILCENGAFYCGLSKSEALKREIGIKKLTAEQKRGLWAEAEILAKG